jgi:hypothetical protein
MEISLKIMKSKRVPSYNGLDIESFINRLNCKITIDDRQSWDWINGLEDKQLWRINIYE